MCFFFTLLLLVGPIPSVRFNTRAEFEKVYARLLWVANDILPPFGGMLDCFPLYAYFLRRLTAAVGRVTAILEGLP